MKWLKTAWHDPVGSKVIAWVICGVLGAIALVCWPALRGWIASGAIAMWAGLTHLSSYLAAPVTMPRGTPTLYLVIGVNQSDQRINLFKWWLVRASSCEVDPPQASMQLRSRGGAART